MQYLSVVYQHKKLYIKSTSVHLFFFLFRITVVRIHVYRVCTLCTESGTSDNSSVLGVMFLGVMALTNF